MPPVISFIGWHNSGKTTLASRVVAQLKASGYAVGVIKSTKETGLAGEPPETDTALYRRAGADIVALAAPDQLVIRANPGPYDLRALAVEYFSAMDIVIAEGFKSAADIPKIEVRRDKDAPLLRHRVHGVIALATDLEPSGTHQFRLDQCRELAEFIEARFLAATASRPLCSFSVDNQAMDLPDQLQARLTALLQTFLGEQPNSGKRAVIELNIRWQAAAVKENKPVEGKAADRLSG